MGASKMASQYSDIMSGRTAESIGIAYCNHSDCAYRQIGAHGLCSNTRRSAGAFWGIALREANEARRERASKM
jgi:hypothetical protein